MALSDLNAEFAKDSFKLEGDALKRVCDAVLNVLLTDTSGDVQGLSVKCMGQLAKRLPAAQLENAVDQISTKMLSKDAKAEIKDLTSLALKTIISDLASKDGGPLARKLAPSLISFLKTDTNEKVEALEVSSELVSRFGQFLNVQNINASYVDALLPLLSSSRTVIRKKTIICIGHLAVSVPDQQFSIMMEHLINSCQNASKADQIRTSIQALGAISRTVGYRIGKWMGKVIPLIVLCCNDERFDQDDELRENCFQAFESLVQRSPKEITPHIGTICEQSIKYIKYDPNYGCDDDEDEEMSVEAEEDFGEEDDGLDDDDEDMSWKVRRSSAKTLTAIINTRPEYLQEVYAKVAPVLIKRFREREENVRLDVFATFQALVRQTSAIHRKLPEHSPESPVAQLRQTTPLLVKAVKPQLQNKLPKTRIATFSLIRDLVSVEKSMLTKDNIATILPPFISSLKEKGNNPNMLIEGLTLLRTLLASHPADYFSSHIDSIVAVVVVLIKDSFYKISAEALRVSSELVKLIAPENGQKLEHPSAVKPLFDAVFFRLKALDADQEVKEGAITCMSLLLANLGSSVDSEVAESLKILIDRLSNEITRLVTIKAFALIASSPLNVDMSSVLADCVTSLSAFLRQNNRQLKQSSLSTLNVIVKNYGENAAVRGSFQSILQQLSPLVSESDLHLSHLCISLTSTILKTDPTTAIHVKDYVYPNILTVIASSLLQGMALETTLGLFEQLVRINAAGFGFDYLLESLLSLKINAKLAKQSYSSASQCIAVVAVSSAVKQRDNLVAKFIADVKKPKDGSAQLLALLCLGEIGRRCDLGSHSEIHNVVLSAFDASSDEIAIANAASVALGDIAVGNLSKFVPIILSNIQENPKREYLLLHSLREVIVRNTVNSKVLDFSSQLPAVLPLLFKHCDNSEEGTRNVVAECLGKLALTYPQELLPKIRELFSSASAFSRSTSINSIKFTIVETSQSIDAELTNIFAEFAPLLKDQDLAPRRAAVLSLNYAAHNKPALIQTVLPSLLPLVYTETKIRPEYIREVEMGPFKHKIDDGLELRKAAFECMYTLLESCFEKIDVPVFLQALVDGLKDVFDIRMLSHLMLAKLAVASPAAVIESLDSITEPLKTTITTKLKESAVKQEVDSNEEMIKSALRAVHSINKHAPNVELIAKWEEFMNGVIGLPDIAPKFEAIKKDLSDA
eukprot:TRINITY_DN6421_c0_g1_i1.p1 TRINITY_DN6421_c0_g1~~TRINITY_DN6421_c0_g1_i1.p1  ORF type:complete len:1230 (+),score=583.62 TRINITY_DN6421_c0_g1_i1:92-3691(+)